MSDDVRGLPARREAIQPYHLVVHPDAAQEGSQPCLVHPRTSALVALEDGEALRDWLLEVRELEHAIDHAKRLAAREIISGMDRRREWTVRHRGFKISAPSDEPAVSYPDGQAVYRLLLRLVDEKLIEPRVVDDCMEVVPVQYKPKLAGIKNLAKNPKIARRLKRYERRGDRNRTLKVGG